MKKRDLFNKVDLATRNYAYRQTPIRDYSLPAEYPAGALVLRIDFRCFVDVLGFCYGFDMLWAFLY